MNPILKQTSNSNNSNSNDNCNHVFDGIQDYILNEVNMSKYLFLKQSQTVNTSNIKNEQHTNLNTKKKLFIPYEKDKLFWCFYAMKNGHSAYEELQHRNIIVEKQMKIEYIEKIRKQKQLIKTYKLSTLSNIEDNLANQHKIDVNTFLSLCVFENLNVLFIKKRTYYELLMNDSADLHIIYLLENDNYGYELNYDNIAHNHKTNLYKIDNIDKPIRAFSFYKLQDLIDICEKLQIKTTNTETNKSKTKNQLYESIIQYL